jgi:hypothetical protein
MLTTATLNNIGSLHTKNMSTQTYICGHIIFIGHLDTILDLKTSNT